MLSSELQELLAACDRILVMSEGRIVRDIAAPRARTNRGPAEADRRLQHAEQKLNKYMQEAREGPSNDRHDMPRLARQPSALANWRDYIIYIGFVVIFLVFAATLGEQGLPRSQQPAQYHPPDGDHRGHVGDDDLRVSTRPRSTCRSARSPGSPRSRPRWGSTMFGIARRHRLRARHWRHRRRRQRLADDAESASPPS